VLCKPKTALYVRTRGRKTTALTPLPGNAFPPHSHRCRGNCPRQRPGFDRTSRRFLCYVSYATQTQNMRGAAEVVDALSPLWHLASEGAASSRGRPRRRSRTTQDDRLPRGQACSMCLQSKVCKGEEKGRGGGRGGRPAWGGAASSIITYHCRLNTTQTRCDGSVPCRRCFDRGSLCRPKDASLNTFLGIDP